MSSSSDHGAARDTGRERLAFDAATADVAWTRRVAIGVVVLGAAVLAGLARAWWAYLVAVGSLIAVRFWAMRVTTAAHEQTQLADRALELDAVGIAIPRVSGEVTRAAWSEIERVEIDHDRLLVIVRQKDGVEVEIEPTFGGLGLEGLAQRIDAARRRRDAEGRRRLADA